jgi:predicted CopG family antitoxin
MMQVSQSDMLQQINHLYDSFSQVVQELHETKQKQESHYKMMKVIMDYISQQNGGKFTIITLSLLPLLY